MNLLTIFIADGGTIMKKKKIRPIFIVACIFSLCFITSMTAFAVYSLENENKSIIAIEANKVSAMDNIQDVKSKGELMFGSYERKIAELSGDISSDAKRINLEDVQAWIDDGMNYTEIENKLSEIQPYPDFIGGSGVTKIEYWLDETGNDKILLIREQGDIIHKQVSSSGSKNVYDVLLK